MLRDLPLDATVSSVLHMLVKREDWVLTALKHTRACHSAHGTAFLRIGVTGTGRVPSRKVTYEDGNGAELLFGAFSEEAPFEGVKIGSVNWSTSRTSHQELLEVLAGIRGYDPKRRSFNPVSC